jgi:hypothetical protein
VHQAGLNPVAIPVEAGRDDVQPPVEADQGPPGDVDRVVEVVLQSG